MILEIFLGQLLMIITTLLIMNVIREGMSAIFFMTMHFFNVLKGLQSGLKCLEIYQNEFISLFLDDE